MIKLITALAKIKQLEKDLDLYKSIHKYQTTKLAKANKVIQLYGDRENWTYSYSAGGEDGGRLKKFYREMTLTDTYGYERNGVSYYFGGKAARDYMAEYPTMGAHESDHTTH